MKEDCTPLHYAIKRNSIQIVRLLTMYGSSVNVIDKNLSSPLHYAAQYADAEVTKFLIDMNANIEAIDKVITFSPSSNKIPIHF